MFKSIGLLPILRKLAIRQHTKTNESNTHHHTHFSVKEICHRLEIVEVCMLDSPKKNGKLLKDLFTIRQIQKLVVVIVRDSI